MKNAKNYIEHSDLLEVSVPPGVSPEKPKVIHILLSRHRDWVSRVVFLASLGGYTHVSICLGDEPGKYYSFTKKGFKLEHPHNWIDRDIDMVKYDIPVSQEAYDHIRERLEIFKQNPEQFIYTTKGVVTCIMHFPNKVENRYVCSQFVAELLIDSGVLEISRDPTTLLPSEINHYIKTKTDAVRYSRIPPEDDFLIKAMPKKLAKRVAKEVTGFPKRTYHATRRWYRRYFGGR